MTHNVIDNTVGSCIGIPGYPIAVNLNVANNDCVNPLSTGSGISASGVSIATYTIGNNTLPQGTTQWTRIPFGTGNNLQYSYYAPNNSALVSDFAAGDWYFLDPIGGLGYSAAQYIAVSGTNGTALSVTAASTSGSPTLTVSNSASLHVGGYVTVAGLSGTYLIGNIVGNTVTVSPNANASVSSAAMNWAPPTAVPEMPTDTRAFKTVIGSVWIDAKLDYSIEADSTSGAVTVNLQPTNQFPIGKQYIIRHSAGSNSVTVAPYTSYINGLSTVSLPKIGDYLWTEINGTGWDVIGASADVLATIGLSNVLSGATGSIGGSALTAGQCASGTATIAGAATGYCLLLGDVG